MKPFPSTKRSFPFFDPPIIVSNFIGPSAKTSFGTGSLSRKHSSIWAGVSPSGRLMLNDVSVVMVGVVVSAVVTVGDVRAAATVVTVGDVHTAATVVTVGDVHAAASVVTVGDVRAAATAATVN